MKRRLKFLSVLSVVVAICAMGYFQQRNKVSPNELLLLNIEAMAAGESSNIDCWGGAGSVDCPISRDKVLYVW